MSSTENRFNAGQRTLLLDIARESIREGVQHGHQLHLNKNNYDADLQANGASFVTLQRNNQLRGCIGSLEAYRPLVEDVAENAYAAAFRDPRFSPLTASELEGLDIHLSILSPPEAMTFTDETDLLEQIRPGIDGLVLEDYGHRGTFLPSVWESLPQVEDFWRHLKTKAGLPEKHWSDSLKVYRYTTESF